ncbi:hypothetical protein BUALT_Bualt06G0107200 [Buddleja alternifolia]|uniref:Uncharacterized protein n=1 Tax=Buddleja alternifolia TaxID=168488 RepID=A0AAV6XEC5_9LAMI|nr:hypothetical protein BUALT_Bualt06G0107200 [Buddleja alternifolia]
MFIWEPNKNRPLSSLSIRFPRKRARNIHLDLHHALITSIGTTKIYGPGKRHDWGKEAHEGYRQSDLASQPIYRLLIKILL